MTPVEMISLLISLVYFLFILFVIYGLSSKKYHSPCIGVQAKKKFSLLVPYKDESAHLNRIWDTLGKQTAENGEIIFIDDHSVDGSSEIVKRFHHPRFEIINLDLEEDKQGKKYAIEKAIGIASGEIIITMDADSVPLTDDWLQSHIRKHDAAQTLVGGWVTIRNPKSFFQKIQAIELMALNGVSSALSSANRPIAISGSNLSYEKTAFIQLDPYADNKDVLSGDDIFLLHKAKRNHYRIKCCFEKEMEVETAPVTLKKYISQRLRWVKKRSSFEDFTTVCVGLLLFFANLNFLFVAVIQLFLPEFQPILLVSLFLKIGIDFLLLFLILSKRKKRNLMIYFIPSLVWSGLMNGILPLIGWSIPVYWKGRKI